MDLKRFKNYGLWVSIISLIPLVCTGLGIKTLPSNYNEIAIAILSIFVMLGIVNNPTTENKGFIDDPKKEGE